MFVVLALSTTTIYAQESSSWSVGADVASRYVWRGLNLGGSSPSIQPYIEYSFGSEDHAFAVGAWGAYSTSGTTTGQEADLYLSYTMNDMFSLTITDYFFPDESAGMHNYYNYNMDWDMINSGEEAQTGHVVEAALSFNGTEDFPVSILFAMNVWGADARAYTEEGGAMTPDDNIVMSKYVELGYSTKVKDYSLDLFAGAALDNPDTENGEPTGFYGQENAGLINLGLTLSKEVKITESFALPMYGSLITNPEAENIFLVFGISL